ncbi:MAG: eL32 family ribosomal protein [Candidatus Micrarchaeota archaeon]
MAVKKKEKPKFRQKNYGRPSRRRIKDRWRRPRGTDNKKKLKLKEHGSEPNIGWRNAKSIRGIHPHGAYEVLVNNVGELADAKGRLIRIAGSVGKKKRLAIVKKAEEMKLTVLNA